MFDRFWKWLEKTIFDPIFLPVIPSPLPDAVSVYPKLTGQERLATPRRQIGVDLAQPGGDRTVIFVHCWSPPLPLPSR
jgi:hypothetical protein